MSNVNPLARLREIREAKAMSLDDLAAKSGLSRSLIHAYEQGAQRHQPRPETITKLGYALGVRAQLLSMPTVETELAPIFMRHFRTKTRAKFVTAVRRQLPWVQNFVSVLEDFIELPKVDIPDFHPPSDPREIADAKVEQATVALRRHWGLGDGVIGDLITLVESKGCIVVPELVRCDAIDAFSQWSKTGRAFIIANSMEIKGVRWRVDIAHELGHLVMHRKLDKRFVEANPKTHTLVEHQAFRFARAFLMPEATFRRSIPHVTLDTLLLAKQHWYLSVANMLYRAEDLGMIDKPSADRMWRNHRRRGWRSEEPLDNQIPVDSPRLLENAIRTLLNHDPGKLEELCLRVGLDYGDIARYSGIPESELFENGKIELHLPVKDKADLTLFG